MEDYALTIASRLLVGSLAVVVLAAPTFGSSSGAAGDDLPAPPSMAFIGDSIGVQSEERIVEHVSTTRPISHLLVGDGATVSTSLPAARRAVRSPDAPEIVVVMLGHGDSNLLYSRARMRRDITAFLAELAPRVDCVRWFEVRSKGTLWPNVNRKGGIFNQVLAEVAATHPNVEVMHYTTWVDLSRPGHWHADQLHVSNTGRREVARMVRQAADGCDPSVSSGPFWDVTDGFWAAGPVAWMADNDVVDGYGNGTYRAVIGSLAVPLTRGQLTSALWRRAGRPTDSPPATWDAVPPRLADAAAWIATQDVFRPADGPFRPGRTVTRGELALAWWRAAGEPTDCGPNQHLPDVSPRLHLPVTCAIVRGVFRPVTDRFRPGGPVNRAQLAAVAPDGHQGPLDPVTAPEAPVAPPERTELPAPGGEPTLVAPG